MLDTFLAFMHGQPIKLNDEIVDTSRAGLPLHARAFVLTLEIFVGHEIMVMKRENLKLFQNM
jgi:hypothetical protein